MENRIKAIVVAIVLVNCVAVGIYLLPGIGAGAGPALTFRYTSFFAIANATWGATIGFAVPANVSSLSLAFQVGSEVDLRVQYADPLVMTTITNGTFVPGTTYTIPIPLTAVLRAVEPKLGNLILVFQPNVHLENLALSGTYTAQSSWLDDTTTVLSFFTVAMTFCLVVFEIYRTRRHNT